MSNKADTISKSPLFNGIPPDQLAALSRISVERAFNKGETVFSEGDEGNGFFIVASGLIKIFKLSPEGKEQILHIVGPGEPFGEVPVFTGQPFPANADVLINSRLIFFPRKAFIGLVTQNPSLSLNMLAVLSRRLRQFTVQIESLSLKEVPGRLATYLIYLSEEHPGERTVSLTISKGQLASLLGTIPETLSRIFAKMSNQGIIAVNGRKIQIRDRSRLETLAAEGKLTE